MPSPPNILVVLTDQQRWDTVGLNGNPLDLTPNFDRVARRGVHLKHCFTPQPLCGPARACLQTGRYATAVSCHQNRCVLPTDAATLAKSFAAAGYRTGMVGKWHLGRFSEPEPPELRGGYEHWMCLDAAARESRGLWDTRFYDTNDQLVFRPGYRTDAVADEAIRFVGEARSRPFFLWVSFVAPHQQNRVNAFRAPEGYAERYQGRWMPPDVAARIGVENGFVGGSAHKDLAGYCGMVRRVDEAFGRMLDALRSYGLTENTVVMFTSDHGCHFRTQRGEFKRTCHDASIRVPGMIAGPGFDRGQEVRRLVSLVDLPPTLLDAAGLTVPASMQGRSIQPLLRDPDVEWPDDVFVQVSGSMVGRAVRTRRWKYAVEAPQANAWHDPGSDRYVEAELYDLEYDPYELENLIGRVSHQTVCDRLRATLLDRMAAAGEALPTISAFPETRPAGPYRVRDEEVLQ